MGIKTASAEKIRRFAGDVRRTAKDQGLGTAALFAGRLAVGTVRRAGAYVLETFADIRLGSTTRGIVRNEEFLKRQSVCKDGNAYQPTSARKFARILASADFDVKRGTFFDLGAGRGRALLLAAEAGFGSVVGVELDPRLAADAERNLRKWATRHGGDNRRLEILVEDAALVALPDGALFIFAFNPFGAKTLRRVLERVEASYCSSPRQIYFAYYNPLHTAVVEGLPNFIWKARGRDWNLYVLEPNKVAAIGIQDEIWARQAPQ